MLARLPADSTPLSVLAATTLGDGSGWTPTGRSAPWSCAPPRPCPPPGEGASGAARSGRRSGSSRANSPTRPSPSVFPVTRASTGRALSARTAAGQPVHLSARQLLRDPPELPTAGRQVFVCENPAVGRRGRQPPRRQRRTAGVHRRAPRSGRHAAAPAACGERREAALPRRLRLAGHHDRQQRHRRIRARPWRPHRGGLPSRSRCRRRSAGGRLSRPCGIQRSPRRCCLCRSRSRRSGHRQPLDDWRPADIGPDVRSPSAKGPARRRRSAGWQRA